MKTFADHVRWYIKYVKDGDREIAGEFAVAVSWVHYWAAGINIPHPLFQTKVLDWIRRHASRES